MKLVNYQLESQIENLSEDKSQEYFKNYIQNILEDDTKPYYQKADYVGLSLSELKSKIDNLSSNIKELQDLKKKLSNALDIGKILVADVFIKNGIDRIDGNIISSLTLTSPTTKSTTDLTILDEKEVMRLGYVKFEPDLEAIKIALQTKDGLEELDKFVQFITIEEQIPAKVKINQKRSANNSTITPVEEILTIDIAA